jgi:D-alanyl-D-alanine carboxypeptidase
MNARAAELGLRNTHFLNPHGLDAPGHYSTAADLARLTIAMMRQPTLARIVATRDHLVPGPPLYGFRNSNPLLGVVEGVDGGKTGFTDQAGRCFAVSAVRGGRHVVAVVLGSQNIAQDGQLLLDFAFTSHEWVAALPERARSLEYRSDRERGAARFAAQPLVAMPVWETARVRTRVVVDEARAEDGGLGRLIVSTALRRLGEFPLMLPALRS